MPFFVFLYLITYFTKKATERDDENNFFLCFLDGVRWFYKVVVNNIYFLVASHQVPFFVFLYLITYFTKKDSEEGDELTKINEIF